MSNKEGRLKSIFKSYQFSIMLLCGVAIGAILGIVMGEDTAVLQPFADIFLNLVFCLIVPVVFVSIANSIARMGDVKKLGKVLGYFFVVIIVGAIITALLAYCTVSIFDPAKGVVMSFTENVDPGDTSLNFVNLFTTDDFVNLLSIKNMMPLIVFAILFGISVASLGEEGEPIINILESTTKALSKMVSIVMLYAPIGIACYFATLIGQSGSDIIGSIARVSIIYAVFCVVYFIGYGIIVPYMSGGTEAVKRYWKSIWLPAATAAGACSSSACIPVNMLAADEMGIPKEVSSLVIPMGANMHKNGVVSVQIVKIVFLFGVMNIQMTLGNIITAIIVALISGIIVGTVPSGGFIGEMFICTAFGFPTAVIPVIVIMGTLTDPFCTMNNVTGDTAMAMLVARLSEGKQWLIKTKDKNESEAIYDEQQQNFN